MQILVFVFMTVLSLGLFNSSDTAAAEPKPRYSAELVFPLHPKHNHAPGIVEYENGDLLVSWYRGSGERKADDVAIYGAKRKKGSRCWDEPFLIHDTPGFPDCNTCMMIDPQKRLWIFWPVIIANSWESCLTNFLVAENYENCPTPQWNRKDVIFLKPDDFKQEATETLDEMVKVFKKTGIQLPKDLQKELDQIYARLGDKLYQRLGWQPRCKPTILPNGRILLPLYTDTFSISIMAISDDQGKTWFASKPLIGFGNIQPIVLRRNDGTLVAYMRENGIQRHIRVSESKDDGLTWGPVYNSSLINPGAGIDGVRLANGHWLLVYNDTFDERNKLAVSISDDEGKTWKWTRHLEKQKDGSYHYPAVIQGKDGTIHAVYSYFVEKGQTMKHAAFNEAWVQAGDQRK